MLKGLGKGDEVQALYADIQVIDAFGIDLFTYLKLHRWDRLALRYYLIMKGHYEHKALEKSKRDAERQEKYRASLPGVKGTGRG